MSENKKNPLEQDWELADEFYQGDDERKEVRLEDFLGGEDDEEDGLNVSDDSRELKKTIAEVHDVLAMAGQGKTTEQIAALTGLDKQYVYNIQVCAQGFHEDDEIAVAHLVMME